MCGRFNNLRIPKKKKNSCILSYFRVAKTAFTHIPLVVINNSCLVQLFDELLRQREKNTQFENTILGVSKAYTYKKRKTLNRALSLRDRVFTNPTMVLKLSLTRVNS